MLAIEEINAAGGVLGKKIEPVVEDGASDWPTFAEKAQKLISEDKVAAVFGGWTSASRKAMLPVFEENKALLFYPVQYEGLEQSPNIFYTGATTNQQIVPGLDYLKEQGKKSIFLVGTDYVFPRTANKIIKAYADGERHDGLGRGVHAARLAPSSRTIVNKVKAAKRRRGVQHPQRRQQRGVLQGVQDGRASPRPRCRWSRCRSPRKRSRASARQYLADQLTAWNYYQTTDTPANKKFVDGVQGQVRRGQGDLRPDGGRLHLGLPLEGDGREGRQSFEVEKVKAAADGVTFDAPEGKVTVDGETQHISKTARIGKIGADGLINEVWNSGAPVKPDPYLKTYDWADGLS